MLKATDRLAQQATSIFSLDSVAPHAGGQAARADMSATLDLFIRRFAATAASTNTGQSGPLPLPLPWFAPPKKEAPDGKIGTFSQGHIGDCFALTALNATAQTAEGRKKIDESISFKNGVYSIAFAGDPTHAVFTVTQAELNRAGANGRTSTGDPDVAAFEIAISKWEHLHGGDIQGGNTGQILKLLNGQPVAVTKDHDAVAGRRMIDQAAKNPDGFILTLGCGVDKATGAPVNHETDPASSPGHHAFTVTSIDEKTGTATLENPWDTSKEYTVSIDRLASMGKLFQVAPAAAA